MLVKSWLNLVFFSKKKLKPLVLIKNISHSMILIIASPYIYLHSKLIIPFYYSKSKSLKGTFVFTHVCRMI